MKDGAAAIEGYRYAVLADEFTDKKLVSVASTIFRGVVERLAFGVFIVDEQLNVFYCNEAARRLVSDNEALSLTTDGRFTANNAHTHERLKRMVVKARATGRSIVCPLPWSCESTRVTLLVTPIRGSSRAPDLCDDQWLVYLFNPGCLTRDVDVVLRECYELTAAEVNVVESLCHGLTLKEAAESLRISVHTARMHAKHVFKKMGIHSQADLIRHVAAGPATCLLSDGELSAVVHE